MRKKKAIKMTCKKCGKVFVTETLSKNPPKEETFECNDCVWKRWQKKWATGKKSQSKLAL